ncbi:zinc finger protein 436-like [Coregonus clupeaformis]|uniref:zinc finger protein 436-like n=1 Tax=Coregonus clupeaformis TaxID=59861 RepID=UPI001E1C7C95|nr:zinc finger protein 436-like [Coregonus clupeaformis]
MSKIQLLRVFLNKRLTAAAGEIFVLVEKTLAEIQDEVLRSKEENHRLQRLLDIKLLEGRSDLQQFTLSVSEVEAPPEQQHCEQEKTPSLGQEDPEPTQIKEEQGELGASQEEEQLQGLETHTIEFIFTPVCVKSDCDEDPTQPSHLYQAPKEGNREGDTLPNTTTEQIKTEPDGEDYRESEPTSDSQTLSAVNPDCSAAQSENSESVHSIKNAGAPSGFKPVKSKRKRMVKIQSSYINTKVRKSIELSNLKSSSQSNAAASCCKVCGKSFLYMGSLLKHVQTHIKDQEHLCGVCGMRFQSQQSMIDHHQTHIGARFSCQVCSKCFTTEYDMSVHMRIHTDEKEYQCPDCGKSYTQFGYLQVHMRSHTGEKPPFPCPDCDKGFHRSDHLKRHMRSHTEEKLYQCRDCGKGFSTASNLKTHLKIHIGDKSYHCRECGKQFISNGELKRHIRIHTGEKSFRCPDCGTGFSQNHHLKRHMGTHTREKAKGYSRKQDQ